ncbi:MULTISPECIES: hypothetical protein [unclassified Methanoculleus]|uniref:Roadblock/LAMTOR2 domain-containing protein n=1 Tax=Methanoculleus palmolei TaxID=72612 RepID=A0ABD8A8B2_9EURY|nr:hypothetical protein [Methanoculleus sp. UBA377]WOX55717.1 hypothetical protein R6Y95_09630 [Methanoculleus palmolei]
MVIAGFAGVLYLLSTIARALTGKQQEAVSNAPGTKPAPVKPAISPGTIDPGHMRSLEENLGAIREKYSLASFTLATADGLLISSTGPGGEDEAARYSHLYAQGNLRDETGVELLGIPYRGETVIGIARPSEHLSAELMNALGQDTQNALQHWV